MTYAPITLFCYKRLDHLKKTIEALQKNTLAKESELFIFSDGPKSEQDAKKVHEVRNYLHSASGFKRVQIIESKENKGLADSITQGVTEIVNTYGTVIVLEDDIVTSPYFLTYMNDALNKYANNKKIIHINGYCPPIDIEHFMEDTFLYRLTQSWGWATWKDRWELYTNDAETLWKSLQNKQLVAYFNIDGNFSFSSTLKANIRGDIRTWAIKWYAAAVLNNMLCLYPAHSLLINIGNDGSGTNTSATNKFDSTLYKKPIEVSGNLLEEDLNISQSMRSYYISIQPSMLEKIVTRMHLWRK